MKYIDAERLRAEIEKRLKNVCDYMNGAGMKYKGPKYYKAQGKESAYDALLSVIYSFQQEQPSFSSNLDEAAKEYSESLDVELQSDSPDCFEEIIPAFIAGAEWQSKKDETIKE